MWRCVRETKVSRALVHTQKCCEFRPISCLQVWYEWCLVSPTHTPIHNPNGRSQFIGL
jgi:protein arginine N-methyltransferase 5